MVVLLLLAAAAGAFAQSDLVKVASPDGQIELRLMVAQPPEDYALPRIAYQVYFHGKRLIDTSFLGFEIEDAVPLLGANLGLMASESGAVDEAYTVPAGKSKTIRNRYNWLLAEYLQNGSLGRRISVEVRAYDDGVAFRYQVPKTNPLDEVRIDQEATEFQFAEDADAYPLILRDFQTNYEDQYSGLTLSAIHPASLVGLPFLVEQPGIGWVAITEAHLENYAGMYLNHLSGRTMIANLAPRPDDRDMAVFAKSPFVSPWRVLMIASDPGKLIESNLVMNLNPPSAVADTSWIKPGKVVGNWWAGAPANTATVKRYLDFAAESKLEYMLIGPGWAAAGENALPADITAAGPALNLPQTLDYAKSKRVGVWLAVDWNSVERQMDQAFSLYEKWGIAGVEVDGMNRDDQWMVGFYRRVAGKAAQHRLMIDFHGAFKPDGISRTWPNVITQEAVLGLEHAKSSARAGPQQDAMLPFTRMLAGPMDYTPGGFHNVTPAEFAPRAVKPMVLGTRAHQLALYVVFESPLQALVDSPEAYSGQKDFDFLKAVPASWDETRFVNGRVAEYVTLARRSGNDWYVGSITNWTAREIEVPLGFLGKGDYIAEIYADGPDAAASPQHTLIEQKRVNAGSRLKLDLASGGGAAIRLRPQ